MRHSPTVFVMAIVERRECERECVRGKRRCGTNGDGLATRTEKFENRFSEKSAIWPCSECTRCTYYMNDQATKVSQIHKHRNYGKYGNNVRRRSPQTIGSFPWRSVTNVLARKQSSRVHALLVGSYHTKHLEPRSVTI